MKNGIGSYGTLQVYFLVIPMSLIAIFLLVISSTTHAAWNFVSKREYPSASFFLTSNLLGDLIFVPVIVYYANIIGNFPIEVFGLLLATGFFMAIYYIGLAGAYRFGDLSVAYPLARSAPVLLVMAVSFLRGNGDQISAHSIYGIVLVVVGCFLIPLTRLSDFSLKRYITPTCLLALMAACGTAGYSIVDDASLEILRNMPGSFLNPFQSSLIYIGLQGFTTSLIMGALILIRQNERRLFAEVIGRKKRKAFLTGLVVRMTYILVLTSMAFVNDISYVVTFRQFSIIVGTLMGIFILKEPAHKTKLMGVIIVFVGLILVGLG